jgi:hypothetical protein
LDNAFGQRNLYVTINSFNLSGVDGYYYWVENGDLFSEYHFSPDYYGFILTIISIVCAFSLGLFITKQKAGFFSAILFSVFSLVLAMILIFDPILTGYLQGSILGNPAFLVLHTIILAFSIIFIYSVWKSKPIFK